jgi:hypothetical protein
MTKSKKYNFIMETDWLFQGVIDVEQKQYVLLDYFQKLNKYFDELKVYPMFIELSLHLGNMQTLLTQNKILYTDKTFKTPDDELLLTDLKLKDIPVLTDEETIEYKKIIESCQPQIHDYFNFAKSLWSVVFDSIKVKPKLNKHNFNYKIGFFYYNDGEITYMWKYVTKKVYKVKNQEKTELTLIFKDNLKDLTVYDIIPKFSKTYEKNNESESPLFEVTCSNEFPLEETLLPIFKRKILSYINQKEIIESKTIFVD